MDHTRRGIIAAALALGLTGDRATDRERLDWIHIVARGAERCGELNPRDGSLLIYMLRGIIKVATCTDEAFKADKKELDSIVELARKYERY